MQLQNFILAVFYSRSDFIMYENKSYWLSKRCSFECDMGKYNIHPIALLGLSCILAHGTTNEQRLYFLTL